MVVVAGQRGQGWCAKMKTTYPLLLTGNKGLEARRDTEAQLVDVRRLVLTVDLNTDAGLQGCLIFSSG